jgi:hypothetical protein
LPTLSNAVGRVARKARRTFATRDVPTLASPPASRPSDFPDGKKSAYPTMTKSTGVGRGGVRPLQRRKGDIQAYRWSARCCHSSAPRIASCCFIGCPTGLIEVDKGYRVNHDEKFRVWITGQARRGTAPIRHEMKHRAAVGHGRNYLKGRDGDRRNAVLAVAGYNFGFLLRWLARLYGSPVRRFLPLRRDFITLSPSSSRPPVHPFFGQFLALRPPRAPD